MSIFTNSESTLQVTILVLPESSMLVLASMIDPMRLQTVYLRDNALLGRLLQLMVCQLNVHAVFKLHQTGKLNLLTMEIYFLLFLALNNLNIFLLMR